MRLATPVPPTGRALIPIEADRASPQLAVAIAAVVEEHALAEAVDTPVPPRSAARGGGGGRGGGGHRGGGGGRRSDIRLKHDIALLGRLNNGLGFYRFAYNGGEKLYVGVMAQEVQAIMPAAVVRGRDGYLRVFYDKIGLPFETYDKWLASGARVPVAVAH